MWREGTPESGETEYLQEAVERAVHDARCLAYARETLRTASSREPLIAQSLHTPQTPPYHAEAPWLEAHLCDMLCVLSALVSGSMRLTRIEEFARLRGYQGEIQELQETIAEHAALFEAFALVHDAAKWDLVYFDAAQGSRGARFGFSERLHAHRQDVGIAERAVMRRAFIDLFEEFSSNHPQLTPFEREAQFYLTYHVQAHYTGHDRAIHAPAYRALLGRVAADRRLTARDAGLLETLIAHHLEPLAAFHAPAPNAVLRYHALAAKHGYDADDFIDLLQGCLFLDTVAASALLTVSGPAYDASVLLNFLRAEHDFAPWRRAQKERVREERKRRIRQTALRNAGLDGVSLMELLGMEPGPEFGRLLRLVQETVQAGEPLPRFGRDIDRELAARVHRYQETQQV